MRYITLLSLMTVISVHLSAQEQEERRKGSQIIDDSTKQVYGPKTSRFYFEEDVLLNRLQYHTIDTVITNFHRFTYLQKNNYLYQDLGNIGTAIRPIYFQVPAVLGASSGFQSYDLYWESERIKYFDTKSPFANMHVMLGGQGRSMTKATFSRNINPRWNFGFDYRALLIDKQVQRQRKGDRHVRSTYYDVFTSFQSKDSSYRLFANFKRNSLESDEYGGIRKNDDFEYEDYFFNNAQPNLLDAASKDLRMNLHLFHQYELARELQFYHIFDRYRQGTRFTDIPSNAPANYYDHTEIASVNTDDKTKFKYVRNEIGLKGNLLKLFYTGYYAARRYSYTNPLNNEWKQLDGLESYLGGRIALRLDSLLEISGWGELQANGNHRIEGQIKSKWFEASLKQAQYQTPFLYQSYRGTHDSWSNQFKNINVTQLTGYLHYDNDFLSVSPGLTFTRLGNNVFFKFFDKDSTLSELPVPQPLQEQVMRGSQEVLPVQAGGQQVIFSPEFKFSVKIAKHIDFNSQIIYSRILENSGDGIQLPELFVNAQLAYRNIFYDGNLDMHAGIDLHYQSDYYAMAYDVPIQQFYVQQTVKTRAFPIVDVFFSARILKGRIFVKYNNVVQAFTQQGYLITPEYPGQRNILDFGFDWSFYD